MGPEGRHEGQRTALAVSGEMNLARQSTAGSAEQGLAQAELVPSPDVPPFFLTGVVTAVLSGVQDLLPMRKPAASWWARAVVESTLTRDESVCPRRAASAIRPSSSAVKTPASLHTRKRP